MELFKSWFFKHFLNHACSNRPILLLLDGHSTPLDAIAVCDDSSNTTVAEIEDPTSIGTTPDEAITPRREKQIENLTPRFPQMVEAM